MGIEVSDFLSDFSTPHSYAWLRCVGRAASPAGLAGRGLDWVAQQNDSGAPGHVSPLGGRGGFVGDAESEVFDVVDGLVEEHRDVVVVERVDDAASVAGSGDQSHCAQKA